MLGTQANPIVIGDSLAPLGSASNPVVIYINEDWCYDKTDRCDSDADTEVMAIPEFWDALIDESFSIPADERGTVSASSVGALTSSLGLRRSRSPSFLRAIIREWFSL